MEDHKRTELSEMSVDPRRSPAGDDDTADTQIPDHADDLTEAEFTMQLARIVAAGALQAVRRRAEGDQRGAGRAAADPVA